MKRTSLLGVHVVACASLAALQLGFAAPQESPCGDIHFLGQTAPGVSTLFRLISADGSVLAGNAASTGSDRAARWSGPNGFELLTLPPGYARSRAADMDASGDVVVGSGEVGGPLYAVAVRWDAGGAAQVLPLPTPGFFDGSRAHFVSADGSVIAGAALVQVGQFGEMYEQALVWNGSGSPQLLVPPGYGFATPTALSGDGSTVAGVALDVGVDIHGLSFVDAEQAFVWTASAGFRFVDAVDTGAEPVDLSYDGGVLLGNRNQSTSFLWTQAGGLQAAGAGRAVDLSSDGTSFVGRSGSEAYRWTVGGGLEFLGAPAGGSSRATAISADGATILGEVWAAASDRFAFRWTESGGWEDIGGSLQPVDFQPWALSGDGDAILGSISSGTSEVVLWTSNDFGTRYGQSTVNSVGRVATLRACGSDAVTANDVVLHASRMPAHVTGIFVASRAAASPTPVANSVGLLCLGAPIGRFVGPGQILDSGPAGSDGTASMDLAIDLTQIPMGLGSVAVQAGETWYFQAWFRDVVGGQPTSNFTEPVRAAFQ